MGEDHDGRRAISVISPAHQAENFSWFITSLTPLKNKNI